MMPKAANAAVVEAGRSNLKPSRIWADEMAYGVVWSAPTATSVVRVKMATRAVEKTSTSLYLPRTKGMAHEAATQIARRLFDSGMPASDVTLANPPIMPATWKINATYIKVHNQTSHETRNRGPGIKSIALSVVIPFEIAKRPSST